MKLDLKGKIKWVTSQWNKPAKGNYVTIKEMAAYSLGGIGVQFIAAVVGYIGMSAGLRFNSFTHANNCGCRCFDFFVDCTI